MKVTQVEVSRLFNLGQYEHKKIGVVVELENGETPQDAINRAEKFIEQYNPRNKMPQAVYESALNILQNKQAHSWATVAEAEKTVKKFEEQIRKNSDLPF